LGESLMWLVEAEIKVKEFSKEEMAENWDDASTSSYQHSTQTQVILLNMHNNFIGLTKQFTFNNQCCFKYAGLCCWYFFSTIYLNKLPWLKKFWRLMTIEFYITIIDINGCHIVDSYVYYVRYYEYVKS